MVYQQDDDLQLSLESRRNDEIIERLKQLDVNTLTPIEALTLLHDLTKKINE